MAIGDQHYQPPRKPNGKPWVALSAAWLLSAAAGIAYFSHKSDVNAAAPTPTPAASATPTTTLTPTTGPRVFETPKISAIPTVIPTATPTPKPSATATPTPTAAPEKKTQEERASTKKSSFLIESVKDAFQNAYQKTGFPIELLTSVCSRESSCNPTAVNPKTGAVGLFQFMTNKTETLYEVIYKFAQEKGYTREARMVEQYVRGHDKQGRSFLGYRPISNEAKKHLIEKAKDPQFSTDMYVAFKADLINDYNEWLGNRRAAAGEYVLLNNIGLKNMKNFMRQVWEDKKTGKNTMAAAFFGPAISRQNRSLVRTGNIPLTLRGAYKKIASGQYEPLATFEAPSQTATLDF